MARFGRKPPAVLRPRTRWRRASLVRASLVRTVLYMPDVRRAAAIAATHCSSRRAGRLSAFSLPCPQFARMTLGQYLTLRNYSAGFRDHYVAPMCAAVWSVPNAQVGGCAHAPQLGPLLLLLDLPVCPLMHCCVDHPPGLPAPTACQRSILSRRPLPPPHPPPATPLFFSITQVLDFPVRTLIRFWVNHHLLDLYQRPCWRVVSGRSKTYVDRIVGGEQICVSG